MFISDKCTDLKRVYSVFHSPTNVGLPNVQPFAFLGSVREAAATKVTSYNYKLGNKHIYNEEVAETDNNNISLNHFVNAHYKAGKPSSPAMFISKYNKKDITSFATNYESNKNFVLCPNFTYSEESNKGVVQGVSAGGLPITAVFKFEADPNLTNQNFVECGYDLVIQHGQLSYVEHVLNGEYSY